VYYSFLIIIRCITCCWLTEGRERLCTYSASALAIDFLKFGSISLR